MENHPGESRSVSFKAPVGNVEQVFCDLYLTGPKLIPGSVGKTWLKFDVVQVDFGVIPDAQSSDPPSNFIYKADIQFKLSDELSYGCTCVRASPVPSSGVQRFTCSTLKSTIVSTQLLQLHPKVFREKLSSKEILLS
ncbi:hypothetical protein R1flu_022886 [Riccia fluitans]|uniref:Uncharacterized protein n=1 Tax=Riccia fluitans TaxID=41844 RepID=A0ABD1XQH6_9MARC